MFNSINKYNISKYLRYRKNSLDYGCDIRNKEGSLDQHLADFIALPLFIYHLLFYP